MSNSETNRTLFPTGDSMSIEPFLLGPCISSRRRFLTLAAVALITPAVFGQAKKKSKKTKSSGRRSGTPSKGSSQKQKAQPPPPPPWPDASVQTLAQAVERLRVVPPKNLTKADIALQAGLEFSMALANADGDRAASLVEAVGFQPFAKNTPLPDSPPPPHLPSVVRDQVRARQAITLGQTALTNFSIQDREQARSEFPYMAQWMLPDDLAMLITPDQQVPNWIAEKSALIIRMRGRRATIAGGNFLQTLLPVAKSKEVG